MQAYKNMLIQFYTKISSQNAVFSNLYLKEWTNISIFHSHSLLSCQYCRVQSK